MNESTCKFVPCWVQKKLITYFSAKGGWLLFEPISKVTKDGIIVVFSSAKYCTAEILCALLWRLHKDFLPRRSLLNAFTSSNCVVNCIKWMLKPIRSLFIRNLWRCQSWAFLPKPSRRSRNQISRTQECSFNIIFDGDSGLFSSSIARVLFERTSRGFDPQLSVCDAQTCNFFNIPGSPSPLRAEQQERIPKELRFSRWGYNLQVAKENSDVRRYGLLLSLR